MSEHRMSSSEEENEAKRSPSKDQGKVSTISVTYCDEFLVHNLRTCVFQMLLVLAMYQEMARKQRAKLQLKKGKSKPPKADAKPLSADDSLDQLVVGFCSCIMEIHNRVG